MNRSTLRLYRYFHGRFATISLDSLIFCFEPHVLDVAKRFGEIRMHFECGDAVFHVDSCATRTFTVAIPDPPESHEFWKCLLFLMESDRIMLASDNASGPVYANADTPNHFPRAFPEQNLQPICVQSVDELLQALDQS